MPTHTLQPPEWIDAAPIRVEGSIDIAAAPSAVWERIAAHETWPEWFTALDSVEILGAASGVGGGRRVTVKRMVIDEEFTAWDENERFAFAIAKSKLSFLEAMAESVCIESTETGSRVVYCQGMQAKRGFGKLLDLAFKRNAKQLDAALVNLKRLVEDN
ncbi:MAG: SRPBCC family protein [Ilumatobacteraceae bacterium]|nr:SRPBCC family protein [Ilumatobacteraceae bacterium]